MEQKLVICRVLESGVGTGVRREYDFQRVTLRELKMGGSIKISDTRKMRVVSLTDEELTFNIDDRQGYTLNRYWQVLGTVRLDNKSRYEDEGERFVFYFETPVEKAEPGLYDHMVNLINEMRENAQDQDQWKNIPLAHEMMHLFKDCTPLRDEEINPVVRMSGIAAMEGEYLLVNQDVPRLFLSFYLYWEICSQLKEERDEDTNKEESFNKSLYDNIFKYTWSIDPNMTTELYLKLFDKDTTLRFDLLQLTPEWEKAIYDIERETAEELKGESKGMGYCFPYWATKTAKAAKRGLKWRSPHIMNPRVIFD